MPRGLTRLRPHTRTRAGIAVPAKQGLLPLNQRSMLFQNWLAYHAFQGIAFDLAERSSLVADLGDKFAMVLRNHGIVTCGRAFAEAFRLMHDLERSAAPQLGASSGEMKNGRWKPARQPADTPISTTQSEGGIPDSEWAAFKRMLERTDPDFAN